MGDIGKDMNRKRKKIINIYTLISLLFLVFGIELFYYFYNGIGNFLQKIPIDFVNENQLYFSYGILILIFLGGFISGIVAVKRNIIRKIPIVVMLLNFIAVLAVAFILGTGIYNDYKSNQENVTEYQEKNEEQLTGEAITRDTQEDITSPKEEIQQSPGIHTYSFVYGGYGGFEDTWEDAYRVCIQEDNAHLVTFETQEEFDYVTEQLTNMGCQNYIFYIGGRRDMNSQQYYWVDTDNNLTGDMLNNAESWTAGCWLMGEPSFRNENLDLEEYVMSLFYKKDIGRWVWKDVPDDLTVFPAYRRKIGYICEYEN